MARPKCAKHVHPGLREGSEGVQALRVADPHAPLRPKTPNILPSPAQQGRATVSSYGQELAAKRIVRSLPQPPALTVVTGVSLTRVLILTVPLPVRVTFSKLFNSAKTKCSHL